MDTANIARARLLLTSVQPRRAAPWGALGAAALAATAAVLMAGVMVLGPGVHFDEPPSAALGDPAA